MKQEEIKLKVKHGRICHIKPERHSEELEEAAENYIAPIENDEGLDYINFNGRDIKDAFIAGAEWQKEKKIAESSDEELVRHPPITYTYPSDASRDEQLKMALLALLNSDLIKVVGNKFTKQDLIDWVEKQEEQKPVGNSDFKTKLAEYMTKNCTGYSYNISSESILQMAKEELIKRGELKERKTSWSEEQMLKKSMPTWKRSRNNYEDPCIGSAFEKTGRRYTALYMGGYFIDLDDLFNKLPKEDKV